MPQKISTNNLELNYVPLNEKIRKRCESNEVTFFSVEFFPPKTRNAMGNMISCFDNFRQLGALFADVTWHPNINLNSILDVLSIQVADIALNYCCLNTMLHLTCGGMTTDNLFVILDRLKEIGIRNILALRGDLEPTRTVTDFKHALDLVQFIRKHYGDYFTIAVAGYPTKHPESINKEMDLHHLKKKVDAGADFIITQLFFESDVYLKFVQDCRDIGITVPIIPGIMPIQSYDSLEKIARLSQLDIPRRIIQELDSIKHNDEAVRNYGIEWTISLCREIIRSQKTPGLHFYTLNRQHATANIVKALSLVNTIPRALPWSTAVNHRRCSETVRPIFWQSRPKSYLHRTNTWDEFPNGRWGNIDSPAFGDLSDYHLFFEPIQQRKSKFLEMWGHELRCEEDVWDIFYCFITGHKNRFGFRVESLPWNDELRSESQFIIDKLSELNKRGILTINSQPNINGIRSEDENFGWGSSNGYVYQKAYVEFFVPKDKTKRLLDILKNYPLVNYQIIDQKNDVFYTNCSEDEPIAVTWGVFPGKEIIQPTIVDVVSFKVWKDEAFSLWIDKWAMIYPEGSLSRDILQNIFENYHLVNLVDNEYPKQTCLWNILSETLNNDHQY